MNVIGVIPARFFSTRFDGKVLANIAGKPMLPGGTLHDQREQPDERGDEGPDTDRHRLHPSHVLGGSVRDEL